MLGAGRRTFNHRTGKYKSNVLLWHECVVEGGRWGREHLFVGKQLLRFLGWAKKHLPVVRISAKLSSFTLHTPSAAWQTDMTTPRVVVQIWNKDRRFQKQDCQEQLHQIENEMWNSAKINARFRNVTRSYSRSPKSCYYWIWKNVGGKLIHNRKERVRPALWTNLISELARKNRTGLTLLLHRLDPVDARHNGRERASRNPTTSKILKLHVKTQCAQRENNACADKIIAIEIYSASNQRLYIASRCAASNSNSNATTFDGTARIDFSARKGGRGWAHSANSSSHRKHVESGRHQPRSTASVNLNVPQRKQRSTSQLAYNRIYPSEKPRTWNHAIVHAEQVWKRRLKSDQCPFSIARV